MVSYVQAQQEAKRLAQSQGASRPGAGYNQNFGRL